MKDVQTAALHHTIRVAGLELVDKHFLFALCNTARSPAREVKRRINIHVGRVGCLAAAFELLATSSADRCGGRAHS